MLNLFCAKYAQESSEGPLAHSEFSPDPVMEGRTSRWGVGLGLVGLALVCFFAAAQRPGTYVHFALISAGTTLLGLLIMVLTGFWVKKAMRRASLRRVAEFVSLDYAAGFVTDALGQILYFNGAARSRFHLSGSRRLAMSCKRCLQNPRRCFGGCNRLRMTMAPPAKMW